MSQQWVRPIFERLYWVFEKKYKSMKNYNN